MECSKAIIDCKADDDFDYKDTPLCLVWRKGSVDVNVDEQSLGISSDFQY